MLGPPLLYSLLLLLHSGFEPQQLPRPLIGGFASVWAGSLLSTLAFLSRDLPTWRAIFPEPGRFDEIATRSLLRFIGWGLLLFAYVLLFRDAMARLTML
jgi:hypothetical protein